MPEVLDRPPQTISTGTARPRPARPPAAPAWTPRPIPVGQIFRISWVTYAQYVAIDDALPPKNYHATYVDGELQLMSHGPLHEELKTAIDRLLIAADGVLDVPLSCLGNVTLRRPAGNRDAPEGRGFESDSCYYLDTDVQQFRGMTPEELPPPDLGLEVEVEVSVDSLGKLPAYAAKGVGEVWRADGERGLTFLKLHGGPGGDYREIAGSEILPGLTPAVVWEAVTTVPMGTSMHRYVRDLEAFLEERFPGD